MTSHNTDDNMAIIDSFDTSKFESEYRQMIKLETEFLHLMNETNTVKRTQLINDFLGQELPMTELLFDADRWLRLPFYGKWLSKLQNAAKNLRDGGILPEQIRGGKMTRRELDVMRQEFVKKALSDFFQVSKPSSVLCSRQLQLRHAGRFLEWLSSRMVQWSF